MKATLQYIANKSGCTDPVCLNRWEIIENEVIWHRGTPVLFRDEINDLTEEPGD